MKKFKKFLAALLVALMALAVIPAGAFAVDSGSWTPVGTKTVVDGAVPQTFTYTVTNTATQALGTLTKPATVDDATGTVTVDATGTPTDITFDTIQLNGAGYYYFTIEEDKHDLYTPTTDTVSTYYAVVAVDNTGATQMIYSTDEITDFASIDFDQDGGNVAVTNPTSKVSAMSFSNTMITGHDLQIYKTTKGSASNSEDFFPVSIEVTGNTGTVTFTGYDETGKIITKDLNGNGTVTGLYVKNGTSASISSTAIKTDATITVTETNTKKYTAVFSGVTGGTQTNNSYTFTKTEGTDQVTITNTKDATTITGFVMHYAPYIALIAFAGVAVALVAKRRNHSEF